MRISAQSRKMSKKMLSAAKAAKAAKSADSINNVDGGAVLRSESGDWPLIKDASGKPVAFGVRRGALSESWAYSCRGEGGRDKVYTKDGRIKFDFVSIKFDMLKFQEDKVLLTEAAIDFDFIDALNLSAMEIPSLRFTIRYDPTTIEVVKDKDGKVYRSKDGKVVFYKARCVVDRLVKVERMPEMGRLKIGRWDELEYKAVKAAARASRSSGLVSVETESED